MKQRSAQNSVIKWRLATSYTSSLISIALVLFVLSLIGLIMMNEHRISNHIKESVSLTIFLKPDINEANQINFRKTIEADEMVKSADYVSEEQAAERLAETLGKNMVDLAGSNPVPPSIEIRLYADYTTVENFAAIERKFQDSEFVDSIHYNKENIANLTGKFQTISFVLLVLGALLFVISSVLIHNTIRLSVYSKRFIIRTMQLVGATNSYIRSPFIMRGAFQGVLSALIAIGILSVVLYFLQNNVNKFVNFLDFELLGVLFLSLILIGMLLSVVATFFAVNKFLRIHKDDLYI
ncbi:MAG: ABC transporter permease [Bacteroidetes bacterium]|nr:ABC transporter permease [Bacteroidota bacterium]